MTFLIDFDGTVIPRVPGIGFSTYDTGAEKVLKRLVKCGHSIVLFTCRNNSKNNPYNYHGDLSKPRKETSLEEAIRWFSDRDIPLAGVNYAPGQKNQIGDAKKALGDFIIDDTCLGIPKKIITIDWTSYETGETEYGVASYCVDWKKIEKELLRQGLIK